MISMLCDLQRKSLLAHAFEDPSLCRSPGCLRPFELPLRRNCAEKVLQRSTAITSIQLNFNLEGNLHVDGNNFGVQTARSLAQDWLLLV